MAKMYYSEEETSQVLGVDNDGLMELVNAAKLQMYQDGAKHVYKASDVNALAQEMGVAAIGSEDDEAAIKQDYQQAFEKVDVIVGHSSPSTAFKIGEKIDDPISMYMNDVYTATVNLAGIPVGGVVGH